LGLRTLKYRRSHGDMIEVFKITKHKYDYKVAPELIYNINKITKRNYFRLSKNRSHYDLRKFSFINRIVNIWNSLPNAVVDVDTVDLFVNFINFIYNIVYWLELKPKVKIRADKI